MNAAINTIEFPDCIPVAEQIKLTVYDWHIVNNEVNIILVGYLRPPSQQNIQISHTTHTIMATKNKPMCYIWNLKNSKLYIDNAVISTVTDSCNARIVYTRWINNVLAAPYRSDAFDGSFCSGPKKLYVNGEEFCWFPYWG